MMIADLEKHGVMLCVWFARALMFFLIQGVGLLAAYAVMGFDTSPDVFPSGLRLDPIHAGVHALWGAAATYVGFWLPRRAVGFVLSFAVFYIAFAIVGTFTNHHFGMMLGPGVNAFHWTVGPLALIVALLGLRERHRGLRVNS